MRYQSFFTVALVLALPLALVTLSSNPVQAATFYVDDDNCPGPGSGTEADPFCSIQLGINVASTGDTVQVAAGTYYENITMKGGVVIQGAGQGVSIIDGGGTSSVVTASNVDSTAMLDGFTITNGVGDYGGGMYNSSSSPTVINCTFLGNSAYVGGGMLNDDSSPTVTNCTFSENSADDYGGGMYNSSSSPTVTDCTFSENYADTEGGGMENDASSPTMINCTFSGNSAYYGGGMFNYDNSFPTMTNCTFSGNSAYLGGGMLNDDSSPTVTNCILWGDSPDEIYNNNLLPSITYSNIQGGYTGTANINADPLFVDEAGGDLHLQQGSPCIDAGNNLAPALPVTDLDGDDRRIDDPTVTDTGNGTPPIVDMGADEFVPAPAIDEITFDQCISELCTSTISVSAHDPAGGNLTYEWEALNGGLIIGAGESVEFEPPDTDPHACPYQVEVTITSDASGLSLSQTIDIYVKLAGNVNGDGNVNVVDKVLVRNSFGQSGDPGWIDEDVNCDGYVNVVDKVLVRNQFGDTCCGCP
jgi:hypothetical protein